MNHDLRTYRKGCRCLPCRSAYSEYCRRLYMEKAKGIRPKPSVKSGHARIRIEGIGSQCEIAELLGVSQATVSRILAGKKIRPSTEAKILRVA